MKIRTNKENNETLCSIWGKTDRNWIENNVDVEDLVDFTSEEKKLAKRLQADTEFLLDEDKENDDIYEAATIFLMNYIS